jgi:hypothetical protein
MARTTIPSRPPSPTPRSRRVGAGAFALAVLVNVAGGCASPAADCAGEFSRPAPGLAGERPALRERGADGDSACVMRLSDHQAHDEPLAVHVGSRHQAWNADQSAILLRRGQVLRVSDSAIIGQMPPADSIWVWSPRDRARAYAAMGIRVVAYDFQRETLTDVVRLEGHARILAETQLGEPSDDERTFVVVAEGLDGGKQILQLDLTSGRVRAVTDIPRDDVGRALAPRWVGALPAGHGFLVGWPARVPRQVVHGVERFDGNGRSLRRLTDDTVPGDIAVDADGAPWFVHVSHNEIRKTPLDRPEEPPVTVLALPVASQAQLSCLARGKNFCVLATTADPAVPGALPGAVTGGPPPGEVVQVVLTGTADGEAAWRRLVAHASDPMGIYRHADTVCPLPPSAVLPSPSLDRRGTHVLFASNWGDHCFAEAYVIELP